jgi:MFS family permease
MTLTVFFITYSIFGKMTSDLANYTEVPSNVFLKRFKPHIWLPITMVLWGGILMGMGFVKTYAQLLHTRAWLGVFEAGLFPGVNYYLSCWYKRNEFGIRAAIFFSAAAVFSL